MEDIPDDVSLMYSGHVFAVVMQHFLITSMPQTLMFFQATEDVAWRLITSAVWNKVCRYIGQFLLILEDCNSFSVHFQLHKPKMWHQYIMRKMEIAKHIGLGPQVCICVFYTLSKCPVIVCWYKRFAYHFAELTCLGTQDTDRCRQLFLVKSCPLLAHLQINYVSVVLHILMLDRCCCCRGKLICYHG